MSNWKGRFRDYLAQRLHESMDRLRLRLARPDALLQLSLLGLLAGVLASGLIIVFRLLIDFLQRQGFGLSHEEAFEELPLEIRVLLPIIGGLLLGAIFHFLPAHLRQVGVAHVILRVDRHHSAMPTGNAIVQFVGAGLALLFGQSVGREGPGIHLGAWGGSALGRLMGLAHNSQRTLLACGAAAAISASFNTPLAGVIFAMEVILLEYTLTSFIPVILAASSGAFLSTLVFGPDPAFRVQAQHITSPWELPLIALMGIGIGILAALFVQGLQLTVRHTRHLPVMTRFTLAGLIVGLIGALVPEAMGIGYDSASSAAQGKIVLSLLAIILLAKLLASVACLGLGMPGGVIGPTIVLGALAGGAMGSLIGAFMPASFAANGFYAILGMGAMMGATLQAPLAALTAVLELTSNPNAIMPAMIAIVTASLTSKVVFGKDSVFITLLLASGIETRRTRLWHSGNDIGLASVMDRDIAELPAHAQRSLCQSLIDRPTRWVLLWGDDGQALGLHAGPGFIERLRQTLAQAPEQEKFDLSTLNGTGLSVAPADLVMTLREAELALRRAGAHALYVRRVTQRDERRAFGVLTREMIDATGS